MNLGEIQNEIQKIQEKCSDKFDYHFNLFVIDDLLESDLSINDFITLITDWDYYQFWLEQANRLSKINAQLSFLMIEEEISKETLIEELQKTITIKRVIDEGLLKYGNKSDAYIHKDLYYENTWEEVSYLNEIHLKESKLLHRIFLQNNVINPITYKKFNHILKRPKENEASIFLNLRVTSLVRLTFHLTKLELLDANKKFDFMNLFKKTNDEKYNSKTIIKEFSKTNREEYELENDPYIKHIITELNNIKR